MSPPTALTLLTLLFTSLVTATPLPSASTPSKNFYLESVVKCGNASLSGYRIVGQHTGAGSSAAAATNNASLAESFFLNETYLGFSGGTPPVPFTFNLVNSTPYMSTAPSSYNQIDIDVGQDTSGFSLDANGLVQYAGNIDFKGFALCNVNGIAPYFGLGGATQLLWKNSSSVGDATGCANVDLKAVYVN